MVNHVGTVERPFTIRGWPDIRQRFATVSIGVVKGLGGHLGRDLSRFIIRDKLLGANLLPVKLVCAAHVISRIKRTPFVFELRDLWPDSLRAVGVLPDDGRLLRWFERLELFLYGRASRIVTVTRAFKDVLIQRGIDPEKIEIVTNGTDLSRFQPQPKDRELTTRYKLNDTFVTGYIGTHGMAHGLTTVLEVASKLSGSINGQRFHFVMLGDGAMKPELVKLAGKKGLDNVTFLDSVPRELVGRYWSLLDVSIIHLKKHPVFKTVIPSKLFEAMAMGIPVLHGVEGESAEIVRTENVGITFEPENAPELCIALLRLAEDRSLRDRLRTNCAAAAIKYDRKQLANKMLGVLEQTLAEQRASQQFAIYQGR